MLKLMSFRPNGNIEEKVKQRLPEDKFATSIEPAGMDNGKFYALVRVSDGNVKGFEDEKDIDKMFDTNQEVKTFDGN